MRIFIIGNGFDLGHDLKTKYIDFRKYLETEEHEFLNDFETIYEAVTSDLWKDFESNLANIDEDIKRENVYNMDMNLESGNIGIEDTLYRYLYEEYKCINKLPSLLNNWIKNIDINNLELQTSLINKSNNDLFLTFNYTMLLEKIYKINKESIIHIHGSIEDNNLIIGHGNKEKIINIQNQLKEYEKNFDEKMISLYRVIEEYYNNTLKDVYSKLNYLEKFKNKDVKEIIVIGHSLGNVDLPYFNKLDIIYNERLKWIVYYFDKKEKKILKNNLINAGVSCNRIILKDYSCFYDLKN